MIGSWIGGIAHAEYHYLGCAMHWEILHPVKVRTERLQGVSLWSGPALFVARPVFDCGENLTLSSFRKKNLKRFDPVPHLFETQLLAIYADRINISILYDLLSASEVVIHYVQHVTHSLAQYP